MDVVTLALAKKYTNSVAFGQGAVSIPGLPGETPEIRVFNNILQCKTPSSGEWTDLYNFPIAMTGDELQAIFDNLII